MDRTRKSNESYVNNRLQVPIDSNHVNHRLQILLLWQPNKNVFAY